MIQCRCCTNIIVARNPISIFRYIDEETDIEIAEILYLCCGIFVRRENDTMPQFVCQECAIDLWKAYRFREKCRNSELIFNASPSQTLDEDIGAELCDRQLKILPIDNQINDETLTDEPEYSDNKTIKEKSEFKEIYKETLLQLEFEPILYECEETNYDNDSIKSSDSQSMVSRNPDSLQSIYDATSAIEYSEEISNNCQLNCFICMKLFKCNRNLINHYATHTKDEVANCNDNRLASVKNIFICDICSKICQKLSHLKEHMLTHSKEKPFKCNGCKKRFNHHSSWYYHVNVYHGGVAFQCSICFEEFPRKGLLNQHKKIHKKIQTQLCNVCNTEFSCKSNLTAHIKKYHSNEYECNKCQLSYDTKEKLSAHMKKRHIDMWNTNKFDSLLADYLDEPDEIDQQSSSEAMYRCSECTFATLIPQRLIEHRLTHLGNPANKTKRKHCQKNNVQCAVCAETFPNKKLLIEHYRNHSKIDVEKCKRRQYQATYKYTGKPYPCFFCPKVFRFRPHLENHIRVHTGEKPYECNVCGKKFKQSSTLATHHRLHTGKPYLCPICGSRSATKSTFEIHMRRHTGERQFSCDICSETFYQMSMLKDHIDRYHNQRLYTCENCGKTFSSRKTLNSHALLHKGSPFVCPLCQKTFPKKKLIQLHLKMEHFYSIESSAIQPFIPLKVQNLQPLFDNGSESNEEGFKLNDMSTELEPFK